MGQGTLEQAINDGQSRLLAQGRITLTAEFLNVNGLIQSGAEEIQFVLAAILCLPASPPASCRRMGLACLPGLSFGTARVPVRGYWDANADDGVGAFILEDITPKGGEISIAVRILSTGNGQIKVAKMAFRAFRSITIVPTECMLALSIQPSSGRVGSDRGQHRP